MNKREIKFRAWDKYSKPNKMVQPYDGDFIAWHAPSNWKNCYEVMQFTGLRDKNGKEIYEGDYFLVDDVKLIVTFEDGKFCFDNTGGSYGRDHINQDRVGRLVIAGHIYENPELNIKL